MCCFLLCSNCKGSWLNRKYVVICLFCFINCCRYKLSLLHYDESMWFVSGHGLVVETLLGRVEVKNSRFINNFGNGVKAKFLDGLFPIVDELLTFCRMASLDNPKFPQLIIGVPGPFQDCSRVCDNNYHCVLWSTLLIYSLCRHFPNCHVTMSSNPEFTGNKPKPHFLSLLLESIIQLLAVVWCVLPLWSQFSLQSSHCKWSSANS